MTDFATQKSFESFIGFQFLRIGSLFLPGEGFPVTYLPECEDGTRGTIFLA
jgi:hypothetical protein